MSVKFRKQLFLTPVNILNDLNFHGIINLKKNDIFEILICYVMFFFLESAVTVFRSHLQILRVPSIVLTITLQLMSAITMKILILEWYVSYHT